jgi:uncharacterized protein (TIGR03437 family)
LSEPRGVAVDGSGNLFIADTGNHRIRMVTPDGTIHTIAGTGGAGFEGDGEAAVSAQLNSPAGLAVDGSGDIYIADSGNHRVRRLTPLPAPAPPPTSSTGPGTAPAVPTTIQNAASQVTGAVAPGELVILTGAGLGPEAGVAGLFDSAGLVANLVAGTEVRFDGVPAPLFYTEYSQVTAQVPYTVAGNGTTHITVLYLGKTAASLDAPVADSAPGLFPLVLNQDGSTNSPDNPAPRGSTLVFSATGEGLTDGVNIAGLPAATPGPHPEQAVAITIGGAMASIAYSGSAPGEVGVLQVNAVAPDGPPAGQAAVMLTVGTMSSLPVAVWLQ